MEIPAGPEHIRVPNLRVGKTFSDTALNCKLTRGVEWLVSSNPELPGRVRQRLIVEFRDKENCDLSKGLFVVEP
jgi:hypothetical protein